jgi:translocation and assembly module TamB
MKKLWRIAIRVVIVAVVLLIVASIAAIVVFNTGWFRERVRERVIAEIEKSTAARVELGNFGFDAKTLKATLGRLVLHGREAANEPPLLSVQSVVIGLHIISMLERKVDLASVSVEQARVNIILYPDGSTNLPPARTPSTQSWAEELINLRVGHYEIANGTLDYGDRRTPLDIRGENLRLTMDYQPVPARYRGELSFQQVTAVPQGTTPVTLTVSSAFAFDKSQIEIAKLHLTTQESSADLNGVLTDVRAPHGTFHVKSAISVHEAAAMFNLPVARTGKVTFEGQAAIAFAKPSEFALAGSVNAQGLGYSKDRVKIDNVSLRASLQLTADKLTLEQIAINTRSGKISGSAQLLHGRDFHFGGKLEGLTVEEAARFVTPKAVPWNGNIAGEVTVDAEISRQSTPANVQANLSISPVSNGQGSGQVIEGRAAIAYDSTTNTIRFGDAHVATAVTRVDASGILGDTLNVRAQSSNLDDLLPALALVEDNPPKEFPVKLNPNSAQRHAEFQGTVTGNLDDPKARGQLTVMSAIVEGHSIDRFSAAIDATRREIHLTQMAIARGTTQVNGDATIAQRNGSFDDAAVSAQLSVHGAQIAELTGEFLKDVKLDQPVSGTADATIRVSGSVKQPQADIEARIDKPAALGEQLDRLSASIHYSTALLDVTSGEAEAFGGKVQFRGAFQHPADDFKNGTLRFNVAAQGIALARVKQVKDAVPDFDSTFAGKAAGSASLVKGELALDSINGDATAGGVIWEKQPRGDLAMIFETHGSDLTLHANGKLQDLAMEAQGSWKLTGDEPGTAVVKVSRANVESLRNVILSGTTGADEPLTFEGFVDGAHATVTVALRKPGDFRADVTIDQVQLNAKPAQTLRLGVKAQDLVVKNTKPITLEVTVKEARIRSAEFAARDTSLQLTGAIPITASSGAELTVRGSVNLIILQLLNPDLVASGTANVQASVRGSLRDPQLAGRMDLKNASLYLSDLPNGVDNANGAVVFDRNRATIENLTTETGGGTVKFTGFIGFGSTLVYRLQAVAEKVRVRYPEDVSTTFSATLALNGTSDASTVSGTVTLNRASFTPRADFAQILAQAGRPASASVAASEYVRGMQFDIRIESGPNFEFQTSLTRDLEAEVNLRVRGSPIRPALTGNISVNNGEVQMFGNRYTVNRGDIRFINPVRVDPVFDMDLETKARGVTVNIAISGNIQKLSVNYSSDPPMQPREIIQLLAVGRTPTETAGLTSPSSTSSSSLNDAGGSLIGSALSAQLTSRVQRFFGASRVKIDPTVNSVDYLPQARLTIEQQVSKDITLTYITNLNRTQEQIVQIEWDFSRQWSAVAVREASGLFGIDFQYKKRFK